MLDSIIVIGEASQCRERLEAYADLGVTTAFVFSQGMHGSRDHAMESIARTIEGVAPWGG